MIVFKNAVVGLLPPKGPGLATSNGVVRTGPTPLYGTVIECREVVSASVVFHEGRWALVIVFNGGNGKEDVVHPSYVGDKDDAEAILTNFIHWFAGQANPMNDIRPFYVDCLCVPE